MGVCGADSGVAGVLGVGSGASGVGGRGFLYGNAELTGLEVLATATDTPC